MSNLKAVSHHFQMSTSSVRIASLVTLLIGSIGIGVASGIAAMVYVISARSPVATPSHLVLLGWEAKPQLDPSLGITLYDYQNLRPTEEYQTSYSFPYDTYLRFRKHPLPGITSFIGFAPMSKGWSGNMTSAISAAGMPVMAAGEFVTDGYFVGLGIKPALGRFITAQDEQTEARVAVISDDFWRLHFGSRDDVLGKSITVDRTALTIVGVAARGFAGITQGVPADFWVPFEQLPGVTYWGQSGSRISDPKCWGMFIFLRVAPSASITELTNAFQDLLNTTITSFSSAIGIPKDNLADALTSSHNMDGMKGMDHGPEHGAAPSTSAGVSQTRPSVPAITTTSPTYPHAVMLPGGVGVPLINNRLEHMKSLLLATAIIFFVTGSLVVVSFALIYHQKIGSASSTAVKPSGSVRASERLGLAASARRFLLAAVIAIPIAVFLSRVVSTALGYQLAMDGLTTSGLDGSIAAVLIALVLVALLYICVSAVAIVLETTKHGPSVSASSNRPVVHPSLGEAVLSAHIALLTVATLLYASCAMTVRALDGRYLGMDTRNLFIAELHSGRADHVDSGLVRRYLSLQTAIAKLPGVQSVTSAILKPLSGHGAMLAVRANPSDRKDSMPFSVVKANLVGPRFVETSAMRLVCGRDFVQADVEEGKRIAVVNEAFARHFFGNNCPLGQVVHVPGSDISDLTIVGVTHNAAYESLYEDIHNEPPVIYALYAVMLPRGFEELYYEIRTQRDLDSLASMVNREAREIDSAFTVAGVSSQASVMNLRVSPQQAASILFFLFAMSLLIMVLCGMVSLPIIVTLRRLATVDVGLSSRVQRRPWQCGYLGRLLASSIIGVVLGMVSGIASIHILAGYFDRLDTPSIVACGSIAGGLLTILVLLSVLVSCTYAQVSYREFA